MTGMFKAPKMPMPEPEKPDLTLEKKQTAELDKSQREEERLRKERIKESSAVRRRQRGRASLLGTSGGELGAKKTLLGG